MPQRSRDTDPVDLPEALAALAAEYLDTRRAEADDLLPLVAAGDFERLRDYRPQQRGGSGSSYGFVRLTEIGRELEAAAREDDRDAIERHAAELRDYVSRVRVTGGRPGVAPCPGTLTSRLPCVTGRQQSSGRFITSPALKRA